MDTLLGEGVKRFLVAAMPLLLLCACRIDPSAVNDYSGLGNSRLGTQLRYSLFLGESAVNRSVKELVTKSDGVSQTDPRGKLLSLGFNCEPLPETSCSYSGSAKSAISSPDRSQMVKFITFIHIDVMYGINPMKVVSKISRQPY